MLSELTISYLILSLILMIKRLIKPLFFTSSQINFNFLETFEFSEIISIFSLILNFFKHLINV